MPLVLLLAAVLGLGAGALVNSCLLRTRDGLAFTFGRRKCVTCARPHAFADHIPLLSYFKLKGKCRRCSSVIPWQYPALEVATAGLFALFAWQAFTGYGVPDFVMGMPWYGEPLALFLRNAILAMFLVPIFIFDYRASIIPDRLTVPAMFIALLLNLALGADINNLLLGGLALGAFFAIQFLVSNGRWVGGGDVRMGLVMGFLLGFDLGVLALLLSYVFGALGGIALLTTKHRQLHSHVPFGTFMVLATIVALVWGEKILGWYLGFFA